MGYERYYCSVTGALLLPPASCQMAGFFVTMASRAGRDSNPGSHQSIAGCSMAWRFFEGGLSQECRLSGVQIRPKSRAVQGVR